MPTLLEKVEASAAERLLIPPGRLPTEELGRYKNFLKVERHRLKILHRAGAGGREISRGLAAVLDVMMRYALDAIQKHIDGKPEIKRKPIAIVAIGGYGRGELNPCSDIDFMFLHGGDLIVGGKPAAYLSALADGLLYTLWDIGLKVGHSVRSVEDCVEEANNNMQSKTSLIEARLLWGDQTLFEKMQRAVLAKCVRGHEGEYLAMRVEDQASRRAKHGNSACMQEPNLKNGCGGLRDFQNLLWMTFFKYRIQTLDELEKKEVLNDAERKQLEAAYDFILRARNEVHYHTGLATDVLTKHIQPAVAHNLGYTDRSPVKRIEAFMRDLYVQMRNVYIITRTLEQRLALNPKTEKKGALRNLLRLPKKDAKPQVIDGFEISETEISATTNRIFKEQPRRLMRAFLIAQQRGLRLHPDLAQMIRQQLSLVDRAFTRDPHVRETFLEILDQRGNVAPTLRAMHETGLLGKYIPEFGKLTCLVQHEFYHQYAADEHTLMCVEKLDSIWTVDKPPYSDYAEIFSAIEHPATLYFALLLHDAGKGDTKDHVKEGVDIVKAVAKRLHLDEVMAQKIEFLVKNHLQMVVISQRRDLDDADVICHFAGLVGDIPTLDKLTLHTVADSLGTSETLWNGFKNTLLLTLHRRARALLEQGPALLEAEQRQRETLASEVRALLPKTIAKDEIDAHFALLPPRYYQIHNAREVGEDIALTHRFMHRQIEDEEHSLEPVVHWHNEPDRGYTVVNICTWDRAGLFAKIAGSFTAAGLNILGAEIFTRSDGIIIDTFYVADAHGGTVATREEKEKFETVLAESLTGKVQVETLIPSNVAVRPPFQAVGGERMQTRLCFDNETSASCSILDIETEDRVGLLHTISQTLFDLSVSIVLAKISTETGAVIDSFYVYDWDGKKITDPARQKLVIDTLQHAIDQLDKKGKKK